MLFAQKNLRLKEKIFLLIMEFVSYNIPEYLKPDKT